MNGSKSIDSDWSIKIEKIGNIVTSFVKFYNIERTWVVVCCAITPTVEVYNYKGITA
jgi:hypothetical protein